MSDTRKDALTVQYYDRAGVPTKGLELRYITDYLDRPVEDFIEAVLGPGMQQLFEQIKPDRKFGNKWMQKQMQEGNK